jgi:hypothetical protein
MLRALQAGANSLSVTDAHGQSLAGNDSNIGTVWLICESKIYLWCRNSLPALSATTQGVLPLRNTGVHHAALVRLTSCAA